MRPIRAIIMASCAITLAVGCGSSASDSHKGTSAKLEVSEFMLPVWGSERHAKLTVNGTAYGATCENFTAKPLVKVDKSGTRVMYRCGGPMRGGFLVPGNGYVESCKDDWAGVADWSNAPSFETSWSKLAKCTKFSQLATLFPKVATTDLLGASIGGSTVDDTWGASFRAQPAEQKRSLRALVAKRMGDDFVAAKAAVLQVLPDAEEDFAATVADAIHLHARREGDEQSVAEDLLRALVGHPVLARQTACTNLHLLGNAALRVLGQTDGPPCGLLDEEIARRKDWLCEDSSDVTAALARNGGPGARVKEIQTRRAYALIADQELICAEAKAGQLCKCPLSFCESQVNVDEGAPHRCAFIVNDKARTLRVSAAPTSPSKQPPAP